MRADPPENKVRSAIAETYDDRNYEGGLAARALHGTHRLIEREFDEATHFETVLEVGAGTGVHINFIRHDFGTYYMTDPDQQMLRQAKIPDRITGRVHFRGDSAHDLTFETDSVDRLIATHVLEHLEKPERVLKEWSRVTRPGGIISLILPCDPGVLWRLGRNLGPRSRFNKLGVDYDYVMALEHINSITNLRALIKYYFVNRKETWWPVNIPLSDINLIYAVNIINE